MFPAKKPPFTADLPICCSPPSRRKASTTALGNCSGFSSFLGTNLRAEENLGQLKHKRALHYIILYVISYFILFCYLYAICFFVCMCIHVKV